VGFLAGDSGTLTTNGVAGPRPLKMYTGGLYPTQQGGSRAGQPVRCSSFTFINLNAVGDGTILVGPNGSAGMQLLPQAGYTWNNVSPGDMCVDDQGSAATVGWTYDGESLQDTG
jgi:hypothetical protein